MIAYLLREGESFVFVLGVPRVEEQSNRKVHSGLMPLERRHGPSKVQTRARASEKPVGGCRLCGELSSVSE